VYDRYGSREVGLIASQCGEGGWMHINAESVLVEFVRNGHPVAPGELGEVLITDLRNYAMPLIRYRIGDLGTPMAGTCACGRGLPLMQMVAGRVTDFIVRPDGGLVSGISLATYLITGRPGIGQVQLHQHETRDLLVKVVPGPGFSSADLSCLRERARSYLGDAMAVHFRIVASIPKEASGKYRFSISEVSAVDAVASRSRQPVSAVLSEANDE
jgi:phenylacetate-CoA ligase